MKTRTSKRSYFSFAALLVAILFNLQTLKAQNSFFFDYTGFNEISASAIFEVEVHIADTFSVEIIADEKIYDNLNVTLKGNKLGLGMRGNVRNAKAKAIVSLPTLISITASGASRVNVNGLVETQTLSLNASGASSIAVEATVEKLESRASGASSIRVSGQAQDHRANSSGASQLKAENLATVTTKATTSGAANARVSATKYLDANSSGTSRISFDEEPESKNVKVSGTASVNNISGLARSRTGDDNEFKITIGDREFVYDEDDRNITSRRNTRKFKGSWSGLEIGINGFMSPSQSLLLQDEATFLEPKYPQSVVLNLNIFQQSFGLIGNRFGIYTGVGFGWNHYRFDNDVIFLHTPDGIDYVVDDSGDMVRNKMRVTYLNIPLMLEYNKRDGRTRERFHVGAGVIAGTRLRSYARYNFEEGGNKRKEKDYKDFYMQPFKIDATARIGWGFVNLFATYSLNTLFMDNKGPELYPFSVGISLVSF